MTPPTTKKKTNKALTPRQVGAKYGFRSGLEERTARELTELGVTFTYEEVKITYTKPARKSRYTPDFMITARPDGTPRAHPLIIETKGRFLVQDRAKHVLLKAQHPGLDIRFVFDTPNSRISKASRTTYADWCEKNGFQYAAKSIPLEWLRE